MEEGTAINQPLLGMQDEDVCLLLQYSGPITVSAIVLVNTTLQCLLNEDAIEI